jgi:succinyl-diaminopimelate desuccinylase
MPAMGAVDPLPLAQALIRARSVTPADGGAQAVLAAALERLGFTVHALRFGAIENLYARIGTVGPHLCFAGHTDVVPAGDGWSADPFGAEVRDGVLYGRGACDMKGAIAAFVAAADMHLASCPPGGPPRGSISLLITGDEEGDAVDGTVKVLEWMRDHDEVPDFCVVGEPTNPGRLGEVIKIGRRGSLNARITVHGTQGHTAYPSRADNPCHRLVAALAELTARPIDDGSEHFEPTTLAVSSIDVGNSATNVIPATATARLNIRFNDRHSGASLEAWLREVLGRHAPRHELVVSVSGESFLTAPGPAVERLARAIEAATGVVPRLDTGGGTSDARFITHLCPVAEFGLVGATMHKADECVPVAELLMLAEAYRAVIGAFLA